jgi:hypothetical protein
MMDTYNGMIQILKNLIGVNFIMMQKKIFIYKREIKFNFSYECLTARLRQKECLTKTSLVVPPSLDIKHLYKNNQNEHSL